MNRSFITALQFLTRITIVQQGEVRPEQFGASVKFFPLVGAVLGGILWLVFLAFEQYLSVVIGYLPYHTLTALLLVMPYLLTGALHADGFMDSCDGLFCGKSRDDMLRIMKDSRVGAMGVAGFGLYLLFKWSLLLDIPLNRLPLAIFLMPIMGRMAMVLAITLFPYGRKAGYGQSFQAYAGTGSLLFAATSTMVLVYFGIKIVHYDVVSLGMLFTTPGWSGLELKGIQVCFAALGGALILCRYAQKQLGGLTGDIYGAVNECAELLTLLPFVIR